MIRMLAVAALVAGVGACSDQPDDAGDGADMTPADPVLRGQRYVAARGCPTCHQSSNPADGTLSGTTQPRRGTMAYPANLTPDGETGIGSWSDDLVIRAMRSGIDDEESPLCPPMPHFDGSGGDGRAMTDDEAQSIVAYLRSLPPVHHEIPASSCPPLKSPSDDGADMAVPLPPPPDPGGPADLALPPD